MQLSKLEQFVQQPCLNKFIFYGKLLISPNDAPVNLDQLYAFQAFSVYV